MHAPGTVGSEPSHGADVVPTGGTAAGSAPAEGAAAVHAAAGAVPTQHLLPSEQQLVSELLEEDSLCVSAAGLGWHKVVAALLRMHGGAQESTGAQLQPGPSSSAQTGPGVLLVLGAFPWQRSLITAELARQDPSAPAPVEINNEVPALERVERYRSGAVCFVTTRILVVDLLSARVLPRGIAGMVVINAHRVTDTSGEGFALKLFRQGSSRGFVRAFSDMPTAFASGFNKVEKTMKALHVRRLVLWPRFQQYVQDELQASPPQLCEWEQDPTDAMLSIHEGLVELVQALLKELQRTNRLDCTDLRPEEGLHRPFDRAVRQQLEPIWNTLSWKARQAVRDLGTVQALAAHLMRHDAVTFLSYLEDLRASEGIRSVWLFHDVTHAIYATARKRVYLMHAGTAEEAKDGKAGHKQSGRKRKQRAPKQEPEAEDGTAGAREVQHVHIEPVLEEPPKWGLLQQVLEEIQSERTAALAMNPHHAPPDPEPFPAAAPPAAAGSSGIAAKPERESHTAIGSAQEEPQQQAELVNLVSDSDADDLQVQQKEQQQHQQQEEENAAPLTRSGVLALQEAAHRPVLVVVRELYLVEQLHQVLRKGGAQVMHELYEAYLLSKVQAGGSRRSRGRGQGRGASTSGRRDELASGSDSVGGASGSGGSRGGRGGRGRGGARTWEDRERLEQVREMLAGKGPGMRPGEQQALLEQARKLANAQASTSAQASVPAAGSPKGAKGSRRSSAGRPRGGAGAASRGRAGGSGGAGRGRGHGRRKAAAVEAPPKDESPKPVWHSDGEDSLHSGSTEDPEGDVPSLQRHKKQRQHRQHDANSDEDDFQPAARGRQQQQVQQDRQEHEWQADQQQRQQQQARAADLNDCPLLHHVHFHALDAHDDFVLWRLQPAYVVLYDPDLAFVRQVEVYKAEHKNAFLRVYHCYYAASLERGAFLAAVEREVSVFAELIRAKQHLVLPIDMDTGGQLVPVARTPGASHADLWLDTYSLNALTRVAGGRSVAKTLPRRLVVDVREFRSSLPAVLHQQGFLLTPMTLEVGDYVLSPELVVERKSVPDLSQSLASGRLFHQAEAMTKAYKTPILLIEFEGDQAFMLQAPSELGEDIDPRNILSRLVLLLLHFPKLRLIWSRSLHATGDIFMSIKRNQDEPDATAAAMAGLPLGPDGQPLAGSSSSSEAVVNQSAIELLRRLPGVTDANYRGLMEGVGSLRGLADATVEQLQGWMGGERAARMLYDFLHAPCPAMGP